MAINLLSYTGTPELGVGASNIPVTPANPNLDVINNTIRDVMLLDNQRNVQLWQQKVKDRDVLLEMIMKNQVSSGDILPEYRKHFDQAEKQAEKAFTDWGGNLNDKEGYRKYQASVQDLKDIAAQAQGKTMGLRALEKEKSQQILPRKQADYQRWIQQEKEKPFWEQITPYQQLHDFSVDDILAGVKPISTVSRDPKDPTITYDTTYIDYGDILRNKRNQYINDRDAADSMDQFFDKLQRLAPNQLVPTLDAMDAQIDRYNQERGFNPGDRGYVQKVKRADVNGQVLINEPKTEFAAKYALSQQPQYVTRSLPKLDKDIAKYGIDKAKLALQAQKLPYDINAAKALTAERYAKANFSNKKSRTLDEQFNPVQTFDELFKGRMQNVETGKGNFVPRINMSAIPKALIDNLGIDPINSGGDFNVVPANIKYRNKNGSVSTIPEDVVWSGYKAWLNSPEAEKIKQQQGDKTPDVFQFIYSQGGNFEVEVVGKEKPITGKSGIIKQGGSLIRSNRLQSYLNQLKATGLKAMQSGLLSEEPSSELEPKEPNEPQQ